MIIALAVYFLLSALTLYQKFRRDGFTLMNISMTILILAIIYEAWKGQKIAVAILVGTSVSSAVQCILVAFAANGIVIGVALALLRRKKLWSVSREILHGSCHYDRRQGPVLYGPARPSVLHLRQQQGGPGGEPQLNPPLPGGEALPRQQVQGRPPLPGQGQGQAVVRCVEDRRSGLALRAAAEGQQRSPGIEPGQVPPPQGRALAELPQQAEPGEKVFVLLPPGVTAPAEGVLQSLEPGLVAVEEHG